MCYNIQNSRDITICRLHEMANIDMLYKRRLMQLLSIIYDLKLEYLTERPACHNTRLAKKRTFEIMRSNTGIYSKSPFCIGGKIWNDLPKHVQDSMTKHKFKQSITDQI